MQAASQFLERQNQMFEPTLDERSVKVASVSRVVELGSSARVANFKAQATGQTALRRDAIESLQEIPAEIDSIRPITRAQDDIDQLDAIVESASADQAAIEAFGRESDKGFSASEQQLARLRDAMDREADEFVSASKAFLDSQIAAYEADINARHRDITLANDIIELGNETRVSAFKGQALNELSYIEEALANNMPKIQELLDQLKAGTTDEALLSEIAATSSAAAGYGKAMEDLVTNWKATINWPSSVKRLAKH